MKYIKQLLIILAFTLLGELLQAVIPLPIPAAIYGLVLMLIALCTGLLKPDHIADTANFLVGIMPLLFVAPTVGLMEYWQQVKPVLIPFVLISFVVTIVVFAVAGLVTKYVIGRGERKDA